MNIMRPFKEASSYAGLAAILMGVQDIFKLDHVQPVIDAAQTAGAAVAATNSPTTGIALLLAGLLAVFIPDRKK